MNARDRDFALFGANITLGAILLMMGNWFCLLHVCCAVLLYLSGKSQ